MIKIELLNIVGLLEALHGMRNPLNSWESSDSKEYITTLSKWNYSDNYPHNEQNLESIVDFGSPSDLSYYDFKNCKEIDFRDWSIDTEYEIGQKDLTLAFALAASGRSHAKYRRMIIVYADIIAPLYWWKEFDTYKIGTVTNSCSTMHTLHKKPITLDDFSHDRLDNKYEYTTYLQAGINIPAFANWCFMDYVETLELIRKKYIETKNKAYWDYLIQMLPSSYNQKRTVMMSYEVLANICETRKNHKLKEWNDFITWAISLPYSGFFTKEGNAGKNSIRGDEYIRILKEKGEI